MAVTDALSTGALLDSKATRQPFSVKWSIQQRTVIWSPNQRPPIVDICGRHPPSQPTIGEGLHRHAIILLHLLERAAST